MSKPIAIAPIVPVVPISEVVPISATPPMTDEAIKAMVADKILLSVKSAVGSLEVATGNLVAVGESIDDILKTAMHASENWNATSFDRIITDWNTAYGDQNYMDTTIVPSALRYWQVSRAVKAAGTLGLPDLDRIATKRWMLLIPHAFHFDRKNVLVTVKTGWADWLKVALPLNVNGPDSMSSRDLDKSIYDQVKALHGMDATLHAEPVTRKSKPTTPSKVAATPPVPAKTPVATPPIPAKTLVATPPVPLPGQPVAPPVNPYHALLRRPVSRNLPKP